MRPEGRSKLLLLKQMEMRLAMLELKKLEFQRDMLQRSRQAVALPNGGPPPNIDNVDTQPIAALQA